VCMTDNGLFRYWRLTLWWTSAKVWILPLTSDKLKADSWWYKVSHGTLYVYWRSIRGSFTWETCQEFRGPQVYHAPSDS